MKKAIMSLYDFTGEALRPWAEAGYTCYAYDIQHTEDTQSDYFEGGGCIHYLEADLHDPETLGLICFYHSVLEPTAFGMAFPVCTDMAVSGAAWFARKAEADPEFQTKAVMHAVNCSKVFDKLGIPFFIENPVSVLSTKWRKPDYTFHPYEYGGYIPEEEATHPLWPEYIAPRDAYPKKTCLWTGGGFIMPEKNAVNCPLGYSDQHKKLGGKSQRTKDIRSATPRGFAKAIYEANNGELS